MLTDRLPENYRQPVRFTVVGSTGTAIQYALYYGGLAICDHFWPDASLATLAYSVAFVLETITNYLLTAIYTFSGRPTWKNFGGFLTSRVANYFIQIGILNILILAHLGEDIAGLLTMIIAGVINFFIVRFFFRNKTKQSSQAK